MTIKYLACLTGAVFMFQESKMPDIVQPPQIQKLHNTQSREDSLWHIYITIDDGPSAASAYIDSVAAAEKAPINVFLIGRNVSGSMPYTSNPYIETGNHSYSHADSHYKLYYRNAGAVLRDFKYNQKILGLTNYISRLPGRNTWRIQGRKQTDLVDANKAADSLSAAGYRVFGWDLEWGYHRGTDSIQTAASIMQRIEKHIEARNTFYPGHLVILCHEIMFAHTANRNELPKLVEMIHEKKEYRLQFLGNYPR